MRSVKKRLRSMGLLTGILIVAAAPASPARAQEVTTEKLINQLAGLETAVELGSIGWETAIR